MTDPPDGKIVHRTLETDREQPVVQIAEVVAELEGKSHEQLTTTYEHLDHVLEYVFTTPPVPEAQVEITFSYEGYRITVEQDGSAQFVKT
jgi:hypothetical protein